MKILKILVLALGLSAISSHAQDIVVDDLPEATMADNFYITLPTDIPLTDYYRASITHMGFESQEAGEKLLKIYARGNLVSCDLNLEEGYIVVHIYTEFIDDSINSLEQVQLYLTRLTQYEGE